MKYFLIAGEKSGDLHASNLIKELRNQEPKSKFRGYGGDKMEEAGMELLGHYAEMAFMGFVEVVTNLKTIRNRMKACKEEMIRYLPDIVILIDSPGFNLRMAKFAKERGFSVAYYIAPKAWAWNEGRVEKIRKYVDQLFCILPFEVSFFSDRGVKCDYVGNPVLEAISNYSALSIDRNPDTKIVGCLPGSRKQEVASSLDIIVSLAKRNPQLFFLVAAVNNLPYDLYNSARNLPNVEVLEERTYDILNSADAAVVVSGTATLETALFEVPQVVIYKANRITYLIARWLVKIKFISLVNLINNQATVREMIQEDFTVDNLEEELQKLLFNKVYRAGIINGYQLMAKQIGDQKASRTTAKAIIGEFGT